MKIAVCISGQTRTFDYCKESIKRFFPDCDFYCHTYDYNTYHDVDVEVAWTEWSPNIVDTIKETLNPKDLKITSRKEAETIFKSMGWRGAESDINCYSMFYSMIESFDYDFSEYDFVVKTRWDIIHGQLGTWGLDIRDYMRREDVVRKCVMDGKDFHLNDHVEPTMVNDIDFPMNDVQFVITPSVAKVINNYREKMVPTNQIINNKGLLQHMLDSELDIKYIVTEQSWQIIRPRHIRFGYDWETLVRNYNEILQKTNDSMLTGVNNPEEYEV